jgi:hypothetical protein
MNKKTKSDNMTITQTQERVSNKQTQIAKVTVPEQSLKPVKDAYATVKSLGEGLRLGTFTETVADTQLIINNRGRLLAVDPKDLLKNKKGEYQEGYYQIIRIEEVISYKPISEKEADKLRHEEHWQDVLYVDSSAVKAANEKRPIALDVYDLWDRRYLYASDWPNDVARVVVAKLEAQANGVLLLRNDQNVEITTRSGATYVLEDVSSVRALERVEGKFHQA